MLFLLISLGLQGMAWDFVMFSNQEAPVPNQQTEVQPEEVHSGPKDNKEKIAIYVFLGWLWISILVMIYYFRQKIKESDRLWTYNYYSSQKEEKDSQLK